MPENKFDKHIADKLNKRELQPSESAWERLNDKLDENQERKKKNYWMYFGYAASIALIISAFIFYPTKKVVKNDTPIIVNTPVDTSTNKPIEMAPLHPVKEAIVEVKKEAPRQTKKLRKSTNKIKIESLINNQIADTSITVINVTKDTLVKDLFPKSYYTVAKKNKKSTIKVKADDLLYAVTHTNEEVKTYYAKYDVDRNDVLDSIKKQLRKSKLQINPETILAEVENQIQEDDFRDNFMQKLKSKVSDAIVAIADRNK